MINLAHQKPVKFIEDIIKMEYEVAYVSCTFPYTPTLAMIFEAAAQSSIVFSQEKEPKIGFLVSLKNIEFLKEPDILSFAIKIKKEINLGLLNEFSFELINESNIYAKGNFVIKLQE